LVASVVPLLSLSQRRPKTYKKSSRQNQLLLDI
jgi:hypothetical protein